MFGEPLRAYYARDERDGDHARVLFDAVVDLAQAIDALKVHNRPQILS